MKVPSRPGAPRLLSDAELAALRDGPRRNVCYQRLLGRCKRYLQLLSGKNRPLATVDAEDLVAAAILDELECLVRPSCDAARVSLNLGRALRRELARYIAAARCDAERRSFELALRSTGRDGLEAAEAAAVHELKETARNLKAFMGQALDALNTHDRTAIIELYHLERYGFTCRGDRESSAEEGPGRSMTEVRLRFVRELDMLLTAAATALASERRLLHRVRNLVRNGALDQVLPSPRTD